MKGIKITACICMALAAAMLLLPFFHVSFPSYFERADVTVSGLDLVKAGLGSTEKKMEDAVENIRSLIKDSKDLKDLYRSLGKGASLVTKARMYVVLALCLPCGFLVLGIAAGLAGTGKNGGIVALALDALAVLIMGAAGVVPMVLFSQWKEKLVDGIRNMESVSTGISFLDTVLDTASDVVAKNIDKIKLDLRPGWYAFIGLALVAAVCWAVFLSKQKTAVQDRQSEHGTRPYADRDLVPIGGIINNGPMGVQPDPGARNPGRAGTGSTGNVDYAGMGRSGSMDYAGAGMDRAGNRNSAGADSSENRGHAGADRAGNKDRAGRAGDMDGAGMGSYAGGQVEDPPTYKSDVHVPDVNGYQGLRAIDPARPSGMIRGLEGIYRDKEINVRQRKLILGRDPKTATLVFEPSSRRVSRVHCELAFDAAHGKYYIRDHSTNGVLIFTYEGGRYVSRGRLPRDKSCLLQPGTIIDIGSYANRFRLE